MSTRKSFASTTVAALLMLMAVPISAGPPSSSADLSVTTTDSSVRQTTAGSTTNTVGVSGEQADSQTANKSATPRGRVDKGRSGADISLTLIDPPQGATVGNPIVYTLRVENLGPETATGVELTSHLGHLFVDAPPNIHGGPEFQRSAILVSATSSQGSCAPNVDVQPTVYLITPYVSINGDEWVRCSLGTMAPGASATVTITLIPAWLCQSFWVGAQQPDPNYANNSTTHCTP